MEDGTPSGHELLVRLDGSSPDLESVCPSYDVIIKRGLYVLGARVLLGLGLPSQCVHVWAGIL